MDRDLFCGRSCQGCMLGGPWHGIWQVTSTLFDTRVRSLAVKSFSLAMFAFSDFIESNYLVDLPLEGASFTWFKDSDISSMSRIDKALVSLEWEAQRVIIQFIYHQRGLLLPGSKILVYPLCQELTGLWYLQSGRNILEMYPEGCFLVLFQIIVRFCQKLMAFTGLCAFKFENMWLKAEGFANKSSELVEWELFCRLSKLYFGPKTKGFQSCFKNVEQGGVWRFGFQKEELVD